MRSDPALFTANLFLYYFECKWILNLKKLDLYKTHNFANTLSFIGDLYVINVDGLFEKDFKEIYSEKLDLKKENFSST